MSKVWLPVALGLLLAVTAPAAAQLPQPRPNSPGTPDAFNTKNPPSQANSPAFVVNPHPAMPWAGYMNPNMGAFDYGQVLRYLPVPPQPVELELMVPVPDGIPAQTQKQVQEIPGYLIAETTTGFYYPERWTLQQLNVGVYQWVQLPAEFRRK